MQSWAITNKPKAGPCHNLGYCRVLSSDSYETASRITIANENYEFRVWEEVQQMVDYKLVRPSNIILQVQPRITLKEILPEGGGGELTPRFAKYHAEYLLTLRLMSRSVVG